MPPSFDEMKDALDLKSKSGIHRLITALVERGLHPPPAAPRPRHRGHQAAREPGPFERPSSSRRSHAARGFQPSVIEGTGPPPRTCSPPPSHVIDAAPSPCRSWAASPPACRSAPSRTTPTTSPCPPDLLTNGEHFALEVKGDSMIEAGIHDGDTVIIRRCDTAENGDIVVALVEKEEATLKRLRKKGSTDRARGRQPGIQDAHLRARPGRHPGPACRSDAALLSVAHIARIARRGLRLCRVSSPELGAAGGSCLRLKSFRVATADCSPARRLAERIENMRLWQSRVRPSGAATCGWQPDARSPRCADGFNSDMRLRAQFASDAR